LTQQARRLLKGDRERDGGNHMRPRALIEVRDDHQTAPRANDTYERVRRTLDDALAELEISLEMFDEERSAPHSI
jgi:hypothetical protein